MYYVGTRPGAILGIRTGVAEDPTSADVRIWRIRPDYATADLKRDAAEILNNEDIPTVSSAQIQQVRAQYADDWANWPWQKGAPFYDIGYLGPNGIDTLGRGNGILDWGEDVNHNGLLDPGEDLNGNGRLDAERPGLANADQVIWYVCNDIGILQLWNCPESGIQEQTTIWGYNRIDPLGQVIFKKSKIIYKGTSTTPANARIEKMYLMQFTDPDLGNLEDDFVGCDTTLNIMYVYNATPVDANYAGFGLPPPACGYDFMEGPLVKGVAGEDRNRNGIDDASDWAIYDLKRVGPGLINLPMTASFYYNASGHYPTEFLSYAIQVYQMMRGLPPVPQGPPDPPMWINPITHLPTPFWLSGDPVTGIGWIDGLIDQAGDRQIYMSSGPFDLALGESQEVVLAFVGGMGTNNINSITVMRFNDRFAQTAFDSLFVLPGPPANPQVNAHGLNDKVILDWGINSAAVAATESTASYGDYRFEGYKLYQFADS